MKKMNDVASEMIPIRLMISIAIITAITVMIAVGYHNLSITLAENQVESECHELESKLYTMISSGVARDVDEVNTGDGTKRTHTFNLPDNLIYLAFGVDPDIDNDGVVETGLTNDGSVIFYRVQGGSKHVIWLSDERCTFREGEYTGEKWVINGEGQGLILSSNGQITLTFELVQQNHQRYVLIQSNDGIEL